MLWRHPLGGFYVILAYTAAALFLLGAGVLSLSPATPHLLRRLVWTRAAMLIAVWSVVTLSARDPYVPGSCADVRTGCVSIEDGARPVR